MLQMPDPTSSQAWADKVLWALGGGGLLAFILGLLKLILYKNKPQSEIANLDASTENLKIDGGIKASDQILRLIDKVNLMEANYERRDAETQERIAFYREQIKYFEALDLAYRNRGHALNSELNRLTLTVVNLRSDFCEKTGQQLPPFKTKTFEEIVAEWPLPESPK